MRRVRFQNDLLYAPQGRAVARGARAFSLLDVIISIAVVSVLISIMLPALGSIKERSRRVVCQSNLRQIGLGVAMYADDHNGVLPASVFIRNGFVMGDNLMTLRVSKHDRPVYGDGLRGWDGIGTLFGSDYLNGGAVFYCPSHRGNHEFKRYASMFTTGDMPISERVVANYHFRGLGPNGTRYLDDIKPHRSALVADGMQTIQDINHEEGSNVLRADLSLVWFQDEGGMLTASLAASLGSDPDSRIERAWELLDQPQTTGGN